MGNDIFEDIPARFPEIFLQTTFQTVGSSWISGGTFSRSNFLPQKATYTTNLINLITFGTL